VDSCSGIVIRRHTGHRPKSQKLLPPRPRRPGGPWRSGMLLVRRMQLRSRPCSEPGPEAWIAGRIEPSGEQHDCRSAPEHGEVYDGEDNKKHERRPDSPVDPASGNGGEEHHGSGKPLKR